MYRPLLERRSRTFTATAMPGGISTILPIGAGEWQLQPKPRFTKQLNVSSACSWRRRGYPATQTERRQLLVDVVSTHLQLAPEKRAAGAALWSD